MRSRVSDIRHGQKRLHRLQGETLDCCIRHSNIRIVYFLHAANTVVYKDIIILVQTYVNNQIKYFQNNKFKNIIFLVKKEKKLNS